MIKDIVEILGQIDGLVSAIIAALGTFLITKYTYNKNVPLDKLEISYNRIYYPIYRLIRDNKDVIQIIEKSEIYLIKYDKYVDRSTLKAFRVLKEKSEDMDAYNAYTSNISEMNRKLRYRLGYLEPNMMMMYSSSSLRDRLLIRVLYELLAIYMFTLLYASIDVEQIKTFFLAFSIASVTILILDIIIFVCTVIIRKAIRAIKNVRKKKIITRHIGY